MTMNTERIRSAIRSDDAEVRRQAVIAIGQSPEREGLGACLLEALGDAQWRVRKEAVRVAREHAVQLQIVPALVAAISQGENVGLRNAALDALQELGTPAAEALLEAFPGASEDARRFMVEALVCSSDERVVSTLEKASDDRDSIVAAAAMQALASMGGKQAERALKRQLQDEDSFRRMAALDGLIRLDAAVEWEQIEPLLADRLARRAALGLLARCERPEAVAPLVQALSDRSTNLVASSAVSLSRLLDGPLEVIDEVHRQLAGLSETVCERLRALSREGALEVRQAASQVLMLARDQASLPAAVELASMDALPRATLQSLRPWGKTPVRSLLTLVDSPDERTRAVALELACDLTRELGAGGDPELRREIRNSLRQGIESRDSNVALSAARCLGEWGEEQDAEALVAAAENGTEEVARACGRSLLSLAERARDAVRKAVGRARLQGANSAPLAAVMGNLGGPDALARLKTALGSQDPSLRRQAVAGVAKLGGTEAADLVTFFLADENLDVQVTAAGALGSLRDREGRPVGSDALLAALRSGPPAVQAAAARALGETGDSRAEPALRERVRGDDPAVALAALEALGQLGSPDLDDLLVEALSSPDEEVVKQALIAMGDLGSERAVERIAIALEHPGWDVRRLAADLLGGLRRREAAGALLARLETETDELVRDALRKALAELEGEGI
jgi:HEAT repeat protein